MDTSKIIINYKKFLDKVVSGYEKMNELSVVICMLARNSEQSLPRLFVLFQQLSKLFKQCSYVIYENDSADATKQLLYNFKKENHAILVNETTGKKQFAADSSKERAEWMARCRNKYISILKEKYQSYDYVIVIDSDIHSFEIQGLASSFGYDNWDCITSNGLDVFRHGLIYYDMWSYVVEDKIDLETVTFSGLMYNAPIKVQSGFGGLAIYKTRALTSASYGVQYINGVVGSEHVGLHFDMANKGYGKIMLNPAQIVLRLDKRILKENNAEDLINALK